MIFKAHVITHKRKRKVSTGRAQLVRTWIASPGAAVTYMRTLSLFAYRSVTFCLPINVDVHYRKNRRLSSYGKRKVS